VLVLEPLDRRLSLLAGGPAPRNLDGRLGETPADAKSAVGVDALGRQVLDATGPGQLVDVEAMRPRMRTMRSWLANTR
jgi:hypothetical protein